MFQPGQPENELIAELKIWLCPHPFAEFAKTEEAGGDQNWFLFLSSPYGLGQRSSCRACVSRPVLKVWPDYQVQPPSQSLVFMIACLFISLEDDWLGFEAPRNLK